MSVQQLAAVFERSRSRGGARLVLLSIANHDGDGGSWPTISTLARESGLCRNSVHEALRRLQADGELKVHLQAGGTRDCPDHSRPNRYEVILEGVEDSGRGPLPETGTPLPPETGTQTVQEPSTKPSSRAVSDQGFLQFWAMYPRRTAKRAALLAWERALRRASKEYGGLEPALANILDSACRYGASRMGQDQKFTPHPATWLNEDRWDDEFETRRPVNDFPEEV